MSHLTDEWEHVHQQMHWGTIPERNFVKFVGEQWPLPGAKFLEIGCGVGAQALWLAEIGHDVQGIDSSATAIYRLGVRARQAVLEGPFPGRLAAEVADVTERQYEDATFDCVVDVCTTQHIFEATAIELAQRVHSWLKPGGWFFSKQVMEPFDLSLNRTSYVRFTTVGMLRCMFEAFPVRKIDLLREVVRGDKVVWHMLVKAQKAV